MKLATLRNGHVVIVSRNLASQVIVPGVESVVQLLERWALLEHGLRELAEQLEAGGRRDARPFDPAMAAPPIPRPPQWLDGSAFERHGRLMERAFSLPPADYSKHPMVYQGNSDDFIAARDDVLLPTDREDADFEGEIGVVVDAVPMGVSAADALEHVRLLVLINDVSLRAHAAREMRTGFGWVQAKPSTALAPVAVTPDELGPAWRDGRVHLELQVHRNSQSFGHPGGAEMAFGFGDLIAYCAHSRRLGAGTVIGSGTFSSGVPGAGAACITEQRAQEVVDHGAPKTGFMAPGESVRMEVLDSHGQSVFGAIDQRYMLASRRGSNRGGA